MAITPLTVTIDLNPSYKKIPAVYVSQLDNNLRELAITLQDGGVNYDVASSGYDVYIEGTKPDYKGFSYDVTDIGGTIVGSVITVPMQTQMTCVKGMVSTEIVLKSGSDRIGSANFLLVVERAGLDEDTDVSETDIPGYIDGAQRAAEAAAQSAEDAEDAKDLAVSAAETAQGVLESIPEDYSDLSNDVDDLKNAIEADELQITTDLYSESSNLLDFTYDRELWKQGAPNALTQLYTVYYDKKFPVSEGDVIHGAVRLASISGFRLVVFAYDSSDAFVARTQVAFNAQVGSYTVPSGVSYVYFGFTTNSGSITITPEQIIALGNAAYAGSETVTATTFPSHFIPVTDEVNYYDLTGIDMAIGSVGGVSATDVVNLQSTIIYRIGTIEVHEYPYDVIFTPKTGYRMYFYTKAETTTSYSGSGWKNTAYTISANTKFALTVAKTSETPSVTADLIEFEEAITASKPLSNVKEKIAQLKEATADAATSIYSVNKKYVDRIDELTQMTLQPMFQIFTDIHGFTKYLKRIGEFHDENCPTYCKDVICLGDMVHDKFADDFTFMSNDDFGKKVLLTIGNHDCYDGTTVGGVSTTDLYNKFFATVSQWGVVQPTGAAANGYCYYYKDYDSKVRLIVLNEYYWDATQQTWFENTLSAARTAGLAVIVAQHQGNFTEAEYIPLNDYAFGTKGYSFIRYTAGYADRRNAVDAFIANGGEFVGWINGHTHCEQFGTFTVNGRTQFNMTFSNAGEDKTSRQKIVDYSMDCFYYLAVDTTNKMVYVLTVGQATNKYFKRNLMLAYNYQTQEVIEYH